MSRVSPNRASSWAHYGQETPKPPQGKQLETNDASAVIYFPLCARKEEPLPPLHSPHPFHLCLCHDIWQIGGMKEVRVRTPHPIEF
jgi:hypothetical protein